MDYKSWNFDVLYKLASSEEEILALKKAEKIFHSIPQEKLKILAESEKPIGKEIEFTDLPETTLKLIAISEYEAREKFSKSVTTGCLVYIIVGLLIIGSVWYWLK